MEQPRPRHCRAFLPLEPRRKLILRLNQDDNREKLLRVEVGRAENPDKVVRAAAHVGVRRQRKHDKRGAPPLFALILKKKVC